MSIFDRLFNRKPQASTSYESDFPKKISVVPGKLEVHITIENYANGKLKGDLICYRTFGLQILGQKELTATMDSKSKKYQTWEPLLQFFQTVYQLAQEKRFVKHGDITQFGQAGIMGWMGILYVDLLPDPDQQESPRLAMILLHAEEVEIIRNFGSLRMMSLLGQKYSYFPCPIWSDIDRDRGWMGAITQKSILSGIGARISLPSANITKEGNRLILRIPESVELNDLPNESWIMNNPLAILLGLNPNADACLTWPFDAHLGPKAISPEGSTGQRIGGCFLLILAHSMHDEVGLIEDGFTLVIKPSTAAILWECLAKKGDMHVPVQGEASEFSLVWE
ncbi:MAG: hypothetical protein RLZZ519_1506 [Bacteroidota bacterium]|jgi:hypothetical protein